MVETIPGGKEWRMEGKKEGASRWGVFQKKMSSTTPSVACDGTEIDRFVVECQAMAGEISGIWCTFSKGSKDFQWRKRNRKAEFGGRERTSERNGNN